MLLLARPPTWHGHHSHVRSLMAAGACLHSHCAAEGRKLSLPVPYMCRPLPYPHCGPDCNRHAAAASGNVIQILSIGEQDEKCGRVLSINLTDRNASTPLHHAAFEGQVRRLVGRPCLQPQAAACIG